MTERSNPAIRVVVQHRLPLVHAGIAATLRLHADLDLVSSQGAFDDAVHVVVTDYEDGLRMAAGTPRPFGPRLLVVTDTDRETDVKTAIHAGVSGYVLYDCDPDELTFAVVALGRGDRHLCARVVERMADSLVHDELTPRELDVLALMGKGLNNKLIARELRISVGTVKAHANAVYGKLHATSRLQAVAVAGARGIGSPSASTRSTVGRHAVPAARHDRRPLVSRPA